MTNVSEMQWRGNADDEATYINESFIRFSADLVVVLLSSTDFSALSSCFKGVSNTGEVSSIRSVDGGVAN